MKLLLAFLAVTLHLCESNNFVLTAIKNCSLETRRSRTDINNCFKQIVGAVRKENREGSGPKWGLVRLEPMPIGEFGFTRQDDSINIVAAFSDVLLHGVSNYTITDIDARDKERTATVKAFIPKISAEGLYTMTGNLLLVPLKGSGEFFIELDNIDITIDGKIVANKDDPNFLGIADAVATLQVTKATSQLTNLFENDPILDETVHHFINSNDQILLDEILPLMQGRVSKMLETVIDKIFYNIPVKVLYPEGI